MEEILETTVKWLGKYAASFVFVCIMYVLMWLCVSFVFWEPVGVKLILRHWDGFLRFLMVSAFIVSFTAKEDLT